jgi:hypothetical protein
VAAHLRRGEPGDEWLHLVPTGPDAAAYAASRWLAASYGFLVDCVDGTSYGVVEEVDLDDEGRVDALLVVPDHAAHGLDRVPAGDVVEVLPLERRVIVDRRRPDRPRRRWLRRLR